MRTPAEKQPKTMSDQTPQKAPRRRAWRLIFTVLGIVTVLTLAGMYWRHRAIAFRRFSVVHQGRLIRSRQLPPQALRGKCEALGVRTVIDLRGKKYRELLDAEAKTLAAIGVKHVHVPSSQTPKPHVVARFLEIMDDPANWPVLMHCRHGAGRTNVMVAIYRMEYQGWANVRARRECVVLPGFSHFDLGEKKADFIMAYVLRERGKAQRSGNQLQDPPTASPAAR